ncbi:hypothetical protein [Amycolatopsis nivea]|uniref:hypothetical protein n=1 Tax=Amycolatopsis nivea TaxID=1644109 RepID=UPI00196ACC4F|nr:hypothetical protein [Amycolatopsis nivea]
MVPPVPADLLEIAEALVPGAPVGSARLATQGNMHHVVLLPGVAAVRISKRPDSAAEPRSSTRSRRPACRSPYRSR